MMSKVKLTEEDDSTMMSVLNALTDVFGNLPLCVQIFSSFWQLVIKALKNW